MTRKDMIEKITEAVVERNPDIMFFRDGVQRYVAREIRLLDILLLVGEKMPQGFFRTIGKKHLAVLEAWDWNHNDLTLQSDETLEKIINVLAEPNPR